MMGFHFRNKQFIILLSVLFLYAVGFSRFHLRNPYSSSEGQKDSRHFRVFLPEIETKFSQNPTFVFIICEAKEDEQVKNGNGKAGVTLERQVEHATVMIKSAAVLTSTVINFIAVVDSETIFELLIAELATWPDGILKKFTLEKRSVWFPEAGKDLRKSVRVCAMERLFIIRQLPDVDSIVYVDTDILFMRPPEDMWEIFSRFNSQQLSGLAPCLYHYDNPKVKIPHFGKTGLNAGVWMMNLTRMRSFPGDWVETCLKTFYEYKTEAILFDQDVANIIFNKTPEYLYELDCPWNYRAFLCSRGENKCPKAKESGIFLMHGNALTFYTNMEPKIKALYDSWKEHDARLPLTDLVSRIRSSLRNVFRKKLVSKCARIRDIDKILTKSLENFSRNQST